MITTDLLASICFLATSLCVPSFPSVFYVLTSVLLSTSLLDKKKEAHGLVLVYCFLVVLGKSVPLALGLISVDSEDLWGNSMRLLGILYRVSDITLESLVETYGPDVLNGVFALLGYRADRTSGERRFGNIVSVFTMLVLLIASVLTCSWFGLLYLSFAFLWGLNIVHWKLQKRLFAQAVKTVSLAQVLVSFAEQLLTAAQVNVPKIRGFGLLQKDDIAQTVLVLMLFTIGSLQVYSPDRNSLMLKRALTMPDPDQPLIRNRAATVPSRAQASHDRESKDSKFASLAATVLSWILKFVKSTELNLGITRLLALLWVTHYQEIISAVMLLWLLASIWLYKDTEILAELTNWMLLSAMMLSTLVHYSSNTVLVSLNPIFSFSQFEFPMYELIFQTGSFLWTLYTVSELTTRRSSSSPKTESFTTVIAEFISAKTSLCVLFLVGLSSIDVLHTLLMIMCSVFLVNTKVAKRMWRGLVMYTMTVLFALYVWDLVNSIVNLRDENQTTWKVLGFPLIQDPIQSISSFIPRDYLLWCLLFCEAIQLVAYDHKNAAACYDASKANFLIKLLLQGKQLIVSLQVRYQIWAIYSILLTAIYLSACNTLNFLRYVLLLIFFVVHFNDTNFELGKKKLRLIWFVFKYYSGLILVLRYLFQFTSIMGTDSFNSDEALLSDLRLLGIERYDLTALYGAMTGDSVILMCAVLAEHPLALPEEERSPSAEWLFCCQMCSKCVMFIIALIGVYWRLSVSMLVNLICVLVYICCSISHHNKKVLTGISTKVIVCHSPAELRIRSIIWFILFSFCIMNLLMDYILFVLNPVYMTDILYDYALWTMFALGYNSPGRAALLFEIYGYVIVLCLLVLEKHCMDYCAKGYPRPTEVRYRLDSTFQLWIHVRVLFEETVLMAILIVAFLKLTVITVLYVLSVFFLCVCRLENMRKLRLLGYLIALSVIAQYSALLSNVNEDLTPVPPPNIVQKPLQVPWYLLINWTNPQDDPTFLNLGTSIQQVHSIVYDLGILIAILVYFEYLADKHPDVGETVSELVDSDAAMDSGWVRLKNFVYTYAHILILVLVLVFVSQSSGLSSLFYCCLCLLLLLEANAFLNFSSEWDRYMRIVNYFFLSLLMLDLTLLAVYQIPLTVFHGGDWVQLYRALGLVSLWRAGEVEEHIQASQHFDWVVFKIIAFIVLRLLILMYSNADFIEYINLYRSAIKHQAEDVRERTNKELADDRETLYRKQILDREEINRNLGKLLEIVSEWNENRLDISSSSNQVRKCVKKPQDVSEPLSQLVVKWMISLLNKPLFHEFLEKLSSPIDQKGPSPLEDSSPTYYLNFNKGVQLGLFVLCSHTQEFCFTLFFLNHYFYASIESGLIDEEPEEEVVSKLEETQVSNLEGIKDLRPEEAQVLKPEETQARIKPVIVMVHSSETSLQPVPEDLDEQCEAQALHSSDYSDVDELENHTPKDVEPKTSGPVSMFLKRLLPLTSAEKPGYDLYNYTLICQVLILIYIVLLYTNMDGESQDISLFLK